MDSAFPILKTPNLTLRELKATDLDEAYAIWGNPRVTEKMSGGLLSREDTARMLYTLRSLWTRDEGIRWGIELKGHLIGTCGFHNINKEAHRGEIGCELNDVFWGCGFMPQALRPVLSYGFGVLHLQRIEAFVNVDNERSAKLLLKLGFKKEGTLRAYAPSPRGLINQDVYSRLSKEQR